MTQREAFLKYYGAMPDDELLRVAVNRESLIPIACAVLVEELQSRGMECPRTPRRTEQAPWFWPRVSDIPSATKVFKYGAIAAFCQSGLIAVFAVISTIGPLEPPLQNIRPNAIVDAFLFGFLGLMVWHKASRVAAIAALALYFGSVVREIVISEFRLGGVIGGVIFVWAYVSSIRGTFAYQALQQSSNRTSS